MKVLLIGFILLWASAAQADHKMPIFVWMNWIYKDTLPLDDYARKIWETRCLELGGLPSWIQLRPTKVPEMMFDAMACSEPELETITENESDA